jgi:hypothetical protein
MAPSCPRINRRRTTTPRRARPPLDPRAQTKEGPAPRAPGDRRRPARVSKCKDFVVNKGHYFGTQYFGEEPPLSDADKRALIAFIKTM